jgi:hypothetical protein
VSGFRRHGDHLVAALSEAESEVLTLILSQVLELIESAEPVPALAEAAAPPPADPALARLFPDGYRDDPAAAAEFRQLTEGDLRGEKRENLRLVLAALPASGEVRLDASEADIWVMALNDALLVVGVRLGITHETDLQTELDEALRTDPTGPRVFAITVHHLLMYLVDSLANALTA